MRYEDFYTMFHCHTDLSNSFTTIDSITKYRDYIDLAKTYGMKAFAFSEHGNIMEWVHKKEYCEKNNIKYIHAVEAYVTKSKDEKIRDNYHVILISKNYKGVLELNKLISHNFGCNRDDGHFYYQPRITFEELINTSDNIIITTACLGSILNSDDEELKDKYIKFLSKNNHRCFLEIQHHNVDEQRQYNYYMKEISELYNIKLIAGTDTHALSEEHAEGRKVLQKAKNIHFDNEDKWDVVFKSYEELLQAYEEQECLDEEDYITAISNTNLLIDMVEDFELDRSIKYPKLYENSEEVFKKKILDGIKYRKTEKLYTKEVYVERINREFKTMQQNGSIDYLLLEDDIKSFARSKNIYAGYSRGSVSGSYIAYLLRITDVDSIKFNLNFERFMGKRISLCDIDSDYPTSQREIIKEYLYKKHGLYCAEIVTFNTIALKGSIRDAGRGLEIPLDIIDSICKEIEFNEDFYRKKYKELFKYVDLLQGVITSVGVHPSATIVSPIPLDDIFGTFTSTTCEYPISQINMKEVDSLNFVKLDLLGLKNMEIINNTCELANIERLTPDNIDAKDENIWSEISKGGVGIFQWESPFATSYYQKLFSKQTIDNIKQKVKDFKEIDLFSIGNSALRPAGASYRDQLSSGIFKDNGHEALNKFLSPTLGWLVYQEQVINFLVIFCGYSPEEADLVRRGFAKKTGTEQFIPKIKDGFIKTMKIKYNVEKEEAESLVESFLKVIEDASAYLFSENHSLPYSYIGVACAYLRHYYPLEFFTTMLNVKDESFDETPKVIEFIKQFTNIKLEGIKFRHNESQYSFDKNKNSIYKGMASIKFMNQKVSNELYQLGKNQYNSFIELLRDIFEKTSINSKQLDILIKLDFFDEFGKSQYLLDIVKAYDNFAICKTIAKKKYTNIDVINILEKYSRQTESQYRDLNNEKILEEFIKLIPNKSIPINERVRAEIEFIGYLDTKFDYIEDNTKVVIDVNKKYKNYIVTLQKLKDGTQETIKIKQNTYGVNPFENGDVIKIYEKSLLPKWRKTDSGFEMTGEKEYYISAYSVIKSS